MFRNPYALWSLILLIPLILFYLFARRPLKKVYSSVMFFIKESAMKKRQSFFRRLLANMLFFLQLIAILLLALAAATPFLEIPQDKTEEHILIILDSSASMQASSGISTRFEQAVKDARSLIKDKKSVSLILAENNPLVLLDKGSSEKADSLLQQVEASETTSNIEDAMFQAMTMMDGGTVYVMSDFSGISDPVIAKKQLNSKDVKVVYKQYNQHADNVGIIDLDISNEVRVKIKNYMKRNVQFNVKSELETKTVSISSQGVEDVYMPLKEGDNIIELEVRDDFSPDNFAFISVPEKKLIKTLYVTNNGGRDYLRTALESLNKLEITEANLPVIPSETYQLYFIKDVETAKILPSTFNDIAKKTRDGSSIIVHMQDNSNIINYQDLQIVELGDKGEYSALSKFDHNKVTDDVEFGSVESFFKTTLSNCEKWVSAKNNTIICNEKLNKGNVLYYGILEGSSDFKNRPDYPLFWSYVIDYLVPEEEDFEYNVQTGFIIPVSQQNIETPEGEIKSNKAVLNKMGFYNFDNRTIGVNLLDFDESNINAKTDLTSDTGIGKTGTGKDKERDITKILIWIAFALVIIELIIIKWRGDL